MTQTDTFSPQTNLTTSTGTIDSPTPPKKSYFSDPKKVIGGLLVVMLMSVFGIAALAGVQKLQTNTDDRSQAAAAAGSLYFDPSSIVIPSGQTKSIPVKIIASRNILAASFGITYSSDQISNANFVPTNPMYSVQKELLANPPPGKTSVFFLIYSNNPSFGGLTGGALGSLQVRTESSLAGTGTIQFIRSTATNPGINQAVISSIEGAGTILTLTPYNSLEVKASGSVSPTITPPAGTPTVPVNVPTPTANPAISFPGVTAPGRVFTCLSPTGCSDGVTVPLARRWTAVTVLPGQTNIPLLAGTQSVKYVLDPEPGWDIVALGTTGVQVFPEAADANRDTSNVVEVKNIALNPVILGANYRKIDTTNPAYIYTCTTNQYDANQQKFVYNKIGQPIPQVVLGGCVNKTFLRLTVPNAPTATPTQTPTPAPAPYGKAPTLSQVDLWHYIDSSTSVYLNQSSNTVVYHAGGWFETRFKNGSGAITYPDTEGWTPVVVVKVDGVEKPPRATLPSGAVKIAFPYSVGSYQVPAPTALQTHTFSYSVNLKKTVGVGTSQVVYTCMPNGKMYQNPANQNPPQPVEIQGAVCRNLPERVITLVNRLE